VDLPDDHSLLDSDSKEDDFELEPVEVRPFFELEYRGYPREAFVYADLMTDTLCTEEHNHVVEPGSIERLHGGKIRKLRFLLADWLFSVSFVYPSTTETFFQSVSLFDRYLSKRSVPFHKLQLMACCYLWISVKVELHVEDSLEPLLVYYHNKFTRSDFVKAESEILSAVDYHVHLVTSHFFLKCFERRGDERVTLMALYLCECGLLFVEISCFRPSVIAFCSVAATCVICGWVAPLDGMAQNFEWSDVGRCIALILRAGRSVAAREQHCPFRKYSPCPLEGVAGAGGSLIKGIEFGSDLIQSLAALFGHT
jgi:hypothetical protein